MQTRSPVRMDEPSRLDDLDTRLMSLRAAHRALDDRIEQLVADGSTNLIELQRLKRQKLQLKDRIAMLERNRLPDIIA
jgi:hypothetical protein